MPHALSRRSLVKSAVAGGVAVSTLSVPALINPTAAPAAARIREYWIQADALSWNCVPNGRDAMMGTSYLASDTTYWAVGYRAFTPNWRAPLPASADIGPNAGLPGPIIRARVGDTIRVHFRNNDTHYRFPYSIHPHGVRYASDSDGSWTAVDGGRPGTAIAPGETYTYTWTCPPDSVGTWVYHDHSRPQPTLSRNPTPGAMPVMEIGAALGLYGFLVIDDETVGPVDSEVFLFLQEWWSSNLPVGADLMGFNGYAFLDNTPMPQARVGNRVRWHVASLGLLPHVFHVHGHRWWDGRRFVDAQSIEPSETLVLEWTEDNPGDWLYHCHYPDHMGMGMVGRYRVTA